MTYVDGAALKSKSKESPEIDQHQSCDPICSLNIWGLNSPSSFHDDITTVRIDNPEVHCILFKFRADFLLQVYFSHQASTQPYLLCNNINQSVTKVPDFMLVCIFDVHVHLIIIIKHWQNFPLNKNNLP